MGIFTPKFDETKASVTIFEKGDYELLLKKCSGFIRKNKKQVLTYGVSILPIMVGKVNSRGDTTEEFANEQVSFIQNFMHNDGSMKATKRFLMAAHGYEGKNAEEEFNEWFKTLPEDYFGVDGEEDEETGEWTNITIGKGWQDLEGKHIRSQMAKGIYEPEDGGEPQDQQRFNKWFTAKKPASV